MKGKDISAQRQQTRTRTRTHTDVWKELVIVWTGVGRTELSRCFWVILQMSGFNASLWSSLSHIMWTARSRVMTAFVLQRALTCNNKASVKLKTWFYCKERICFRAVQRRRRFLCNGMEIQLHEAAGTWGEHVSAGMRLISRLNSELHPTQRTKLGNMRHQLQLLKLKHQPHNRYLKIDKEQDMEFSGWTLPLSPSPTHSRTHC